MRLAGRCSTHFFISNRIYIPWHIQGIIFSICYVSTFALILKQLQKWVHIPLEVNDGYGFATRGHILMDIRPSEGTLVNSTSFNHPIDKEPRRNDLSESIRKNRNEVDQTILLTCILFSLLSSSFIVAIMGNQPMSNEAADLNLNVSLVKTSWWTFIYKLSLPALDKGSSTELYRKWCKLTTPAPWYCFMS